MSCHEFQDWLQAKMDGVAAPSPPPAAHHLNECTSCRELDAAAGRLLEGLPLLTKPDSAPLLTASIVSGVLHDRRQRVQLARRRMSITLGLAASIALLMLAGWWLLPPQPNQPSIAIHNPQPPQPDVPQLERRADDARVAVAALTERVAGQTKEQAKMLLAVANALDLPPMANLPVLSDLEEPLDPAAKSLRQATESVADGIQPITHSARRAFDFFMKEMPMFEIPQSN